MRSKRLQIGIVILVCIFTACQNEKADFVAKIDGNYEITKQELADHYKALYFAQRFPDSEYKGYGEALDEIITKKLKQVDFVKQGYHRDQEIMSNIQRVISEELLVLYFDSEYLGQYISDEVINDYYDGLGREVIYQQIVLNKSNSDNLNELKQKASEIKQKADNSDDFIELVKQFSEDPKSAQRDGKMPAMTWQSGTSSAKNQVIFRMPEGNTRVIETTRQFLIVKVNRVNEMELRPLEEIRPRIYKNLSELYSPRAYSDYDRDKANLLDKKLYEWNTAGLNQLVKWSKIDGFYQQDKYKKIIQDSLNNGVNFEILIYEGGTVDLQKYYNLLNNILLIKTSSNASIEDFKKFIDEALRTELIVENARQLGLDENILTLNTKSPAILEEYVRLYDKKFISLKIPNQTSENYQTFYEETKDSLFYQPDKVNLHVKVFDTEEEAQQIIDQINNGSKFEDLFSAWSVKSYTINEKGETESYLSNEPNYFGDEAFKLSEGQTAGPITFSEDQQTKYAVIKANNVDEEKILTLNEVNPVLLKRRFNNYYFNKFSNQVAEKLRQKYTVEINESILSELAPN